jgi:fucose 4-O-acetylase-like acetyltransferase
MEMFEASRENAQALGLIGGSALKKSRLVWVDYAKVIGIYLVVFGHLPLWQTGLNQYLTTLRMPLFFVLSGYFENSALPGETAKSGLKRLLLPYALFYLLAYAWTLIETFWLGIPYYPNPTLHEVLGKPLLGLLLGIGDNTTYSTIINGPLWFLMALFWVKLLFSLISTLGRGRPLVIYLSQIPVAALAFLLKGQDLALFFSLECALLATPLYALGYALRQHNLVERLHESRRLVFVLPLSFLSSFFLYRVNGGISIANGLWGKNILLYFLDGASGSLMVIALARLLPQRRVGIVEAIAQGTLVIVGLHLHLAYALIDLLEALLGSSSISFSAAEGLAFSLLILALLILPIKAIEKRCPWVLGRFKKVTRK